MLRSALTILVLSAVAATAARAETPPVGSVSIKSLGYKGPGCKAGSVAHNISSDATAFTLLFDNFIVEANSTQRLQQKACELDILMTVPSGWAYALQTVDVRGYAAMANPQSRGRVNAILAFRRSKEPGLLMDQTFKGPYDANYELRGETALDSLEYSPCGGTRLMRLRTKIQAAVGGNQAAAGNSLVTVDSVDGEVVQRFAIAWKRCQNDPADAPGKPPEFNQSVTVRCSANLVDKQKQVLQVLEGAAAGGNPNLVKLRALGQAMNVCRKARAGRPHLDCVPQEQTCIEESN